MGGSLELFEREGLVIWNSEGVQRMDIPSGDQDQNGFQLLWGNP